MDVYYVVKNKLNYKFILTSILSNNIITIVKKKHSRFSPYGTA